jgi:hypothetical protein
MIDTQDTPLRMATHQAINGNYVTTVSSFPCWTTSSHECTRAMSTSFGPVGRIVTA